MIQANLSLREKIHYASIGEYILTPEDMAERSEEENDEVRDAGFQHGLNVAQQENESTYREIMELAEAGIRAANDCDKEKQIEIMQEIIGLCN